MTLLDEIARAASTRRAETAQTAATIVENQQRIAEAQRLALQRWHPEIRPAITNATEKISSALGGKATGDFLKWHTEADTQIIRGQPTSGEQMSVTYRLMHGGQPRNFIKFSIEAIYGPDAAVFAITNDGKSVVRLVVDERLNASALEYWLARIVHESVAIG